MQNRKTAPRIGGQERALTGESVLIGEPPSPNEILSMALQLPNLRCFSVQVLRQLAEQPGAADAIARSFQEYQQRARQFQQFLKVVLPPADYS